MKRLAYVVVGLALLAGVGFRSRAGAQSETKGVPTVKEIMDRLHNGGDSPLVMLKRDLQADKPDWDKIRKTTKDFVTLGAALGNNDPQEGDKGSWKRLTRQYFNDAQAMDRAAGKKDQQGVIIARDRLARSCITCHRVHKDT